MASAPSGPEPSNAPAKGGTDKKPSRSSKDDKLKDYSLPSSTSASTPIVPLSLNKEQRTNATGPSSARGAPNETPLLSVVGRNRASTINITEPPPESQKASKLAKKEPGNKTSKTKQAKATTKSKGSSSEKNGKEKRYSTKSDDKKREKRSSSKSDDKREKRSSARLIHDEKASTSDSKSRLLMNDKDNIHQRAHASSSASSSTENPNSATFPAPRSVVPKLPSSTSGRKLGFNELARVDWSSEERDETDSSENTNLTPPNSAASPRSNSNNSRSNGFNSPKNIYREDETYYEANHSIDLWPTRIPRFEWQKILNNKIANNSKSLFSAAIQLALVETTAISSNRLYLRSGDQSDMITRGVTSLFTEMQDEQTQQVLRHHAAYKSFWYKQGTMKVSGLDDFALAPPSEKALVQTLVSYVPRIVVRRFVNEPRNPLRAPEVESYYACVLFADISGFTPLTASLATLGAEGVERVTTHLNEYFESMINLINDHGGDVVKFAGDALMVIWPTSGAAGLYSMTLLGCQCALALQRKLGLYVVGNAELRIHIGVGAGKVAGIHIGGVQGRHEFFVAGHPMEQVSSCEAQAEPGQTFISPECQAVIDTHFVGELVGDNYRLDNIEAPISLPHMKPFPLLDVLKTRLRSYVPEAVLSHLDTHEYLAELRTVSVLFVRLDITYVNDEESPKAIQIYVAGMQAVLARYEGTVRQFLVDDKGSVLIAAFGLPPLAHEDDPLRAVQSALEIERVLKALNVSCSIGITTGRSFCGAVGSERRREYAIVGDVVNLSARLMVAAIGKHGILCDKSTYVETKNSLKYKVLEPIMVKGKDKAISIYSPERTNSIPSFSGPSKQNAFLSLRGESAKDHAAATAGMEGSTSNGSLRAVVGRNKVLALFKYKLEQLARHNQTPGHVLILEGEAGIGKSKLVEKLSEMIDESQEIFLGAVPSGGHPYLAPWSFIFHSLLDLENPELESQEMIHEHVFAQVREISDNYALPDAVPSWESIAPLLNLILPMLGLDETFTTRAMSDQSKTEALQILLLRLLQTSLQPGSLIILEDAHEFDSASWTLALAASQQLKGVLIVVCTRPPRPPVPFAYQQMMHCEHSSYLNLEPLNAHESVALAQSMLGVTKKLPAQLATQIAEKGQGNPFIIEEMISTLSDGGMIYVADDEVKIKPGADLALPSSVAQLITSKFDRLSAFEKSILKVASVIGKVFELVLLKHLMPATPKQELLEALISLSKAGFIVNENSSNLNDSSDGDDDKLSRSRRTRSLGGSMASLPVLSSAANRRGTDVGLSEDTPVIERKTGFSAAPSKSEPAQSSTSSTAPIPSSINRAVNRTDSIRSEDEGDVVPSKRNGATKRSGVPKSDIAKLQMAAKEKSPGLSRNNDNSDNKAATAPIPAPNSARVNHKTNKTGTIVEQVNTSGTSEIPTTPTKNAENNGAHGLPMSPRTLRTSTPRRGIDRTLSIKGTLKRGLSSRGTIRNLTLRKSSITSETSPRMESTGASEEPEPTEFSFKNETIHEVVYSMMLFSQKRSLHAEIAKWLETTYSESLSSHAAVLGYHWKLSDENPRAAAKWFVIAGQKALSNFSNQEAVSFFLEAVQLMKKNKNPKPKEEMKSPRRGNPKISLPPQSPRYEEIDDISLLTTHRKLGQAYFNLGDFNNARHHLRLTLKLVKVNIAVLEASKLVSMPDIKSLKEYSTVLSADAYTQREVILALLTLAKVAYFSSAANSYVYCSFIALAIAQHSSFWAELAEAYAQAIVTCGLLNQHQLVSKYIQEGSKLASDHIALQSCVNLNCGIYYASRAAWKLASKFFHHAMTQSQSMGDRRRFEESNIFLGLARLLTGKFKKCLHYSTQALESARLRGDVQCQILALLAQVETHLTLRNFIKAASKLDQVRIILNRDHTTVSSVASYVGAAVGTPPSPRGRTLSSSQPMHQNIEVVNSRDSFGNLESSRSGDLSSEFNYYALLASLALNRGDPLGALSAAKAAQEIMFDKQTQPTAWFTFPGYTLVPEIYLRLLMQPKEWKKIQMTKAKLVKQFNKSMAQLLDFSKIFIFASPRYHLLHGLGMLASGVANMDSVIPEWKRGIHLARQYKMTSEEELIQSHILAETQPTEQTPRNDKPSVPAEDVKKIDSTEVSPREAQQEAVSTPQTSPRTPAVVSAPKSPNPKKKSKQPRKTEILDLMLKLPRNKNQSANHSGENSKESTPKLDNSSNPDSAKTPLDATSNPNSAKASSRLSEKASSDSNTPKVEESDDLTLPISKSPTESKQSDEILSSPTESKQSDGTLSSPLSPKTPKPSKEPNESLPSPKSPKKSDQLQTNNLKSSSDDEESTESS